MLEQLQSPEFWVAIAFVIFAVFAVWKIRVPLLAALDDRAARIKQELDEAQRLREEAQHLLAEHKRKQRAVEQEIEEMLEHAKAESKRASEQAGFDLEAALRRREQQATDRIAQAEAEAVSAVRDLAVDIAVEATRKLLADNLDQAKAAELIDAAVKDLGDKLH